MKRRTVPVIGLVATLGVLLIIGGAVFVRGGSGMISPGNMMGRSGSQGMMDATSTHHMMGGDGRYSMMLGAGQTGMMSEHLGGIMARDTSLSMMSSWTSQAISGRTISIQRASQDVRRYIAQTGKTNLTLDEVIEFQRNFYAVVKDTGTGHGAFEVLVNKTTGVVIPEFGPDMMWNTRYGMMSSVPGNRMSYRQPAGPMVVSVGKARQIAEQWLHTNLNGATADVPDQFPGYYTIHFRMNGKVAGMLSVNGDTGAIWYHSWHGAAVRVLEASGK